MSSARRHKLKLQALKPRNPLAVPAAQRKAGQHGPSPKAQRLKDKRALQKQLRESTAKH